VTAPTQQVETSAGLRTEYPFSLPRGYVDEHGHMHRDGIMRLATARDELTTQADQRVRANPAYLTVLLLERTVTTLGDLPAVDTFVVENLFASDLAFLQDLYRRDDLAHRGRTNGASCEAEPDRGQNVRRAGG